MTVFQPPGIVFPDDMDAAGFLRGHWQKRPLAMPASLPGWINPLDADELAWLAGQPDVESRIVVTQGGEYQLRHGPFSAAQFASMGTSDWTLLVQDVDKHLPDLAVILDRFDFLPAWRLDDLMISFAAPGGSVGPHVDAYDVFLLQAQGRRTWHLGEPAADLPRVKGAELDLLAEFEPAWSTTMGPGDMLYLPPGVPHHGVAVDSTLTWSIGFRAPSAADMIADFGAFMAGELDEGLRYGDPDLGVDEARDGALSDRALERVRRLLDDALALDDERLRRWLGCLVTEGKPWLAAASGGEQADSASLEAAMSAGSGIHRHPMSRWAHAGASDQHLLFVDGQCERLPLSLAGLAALLCTRRHLSSDDLGPWLARAPARRLLVRLIGAGKLYL